MGNAKPQLPRGLTLGSPFWIRQAWMSPLSSLVPSEIRANSAGIPRTNGYHWKGLPVLWHHLSILVTASVSVPCPGTEWRSHAYFRCLGWSSTPFSFPFPLPDLLSLPSSLVFPVLLLPLKARWRPRPRCLYVVNHSTLALLLIKHMISSRQFSFYEIPLASQVRGPNLRVLSENPMEVCEGSGTEWASNKPHVCPLVTWVSPRPGTVDFLESVS